MDVHRPNGSINSEYLMGHSDKEVARLQLQATILAPVTRRLLNEAGLRPGMRVLDIGCGTGDVSAMMADIVGKEGSVVGIDRNEVAIQTSRQRHVAGAHLRFEVATLEDLRYSQPFDLAFGRYVLMHQPDPSHMVRAAASVLRPGGTLAFHEIVLLDGFPASPQSPLWQQMNSFFIGAFRNRLQHVDIASQLVACLAAAGLRAPKLFSECIVGDAATSSVTPWFAETLRTLEPELVASFGITKAELDIDTLADRLTAEAKRYDTQVFSSRQVAAWVRIPNDGIPPPR
jgi:2-polyprenyl-3-methyl-5-hydroxy-6-metoxy-1,4-benzoquinol methylase